MNNELNAQLLFLSNSKNDWFELCYTLLDEDFDHIVYFETKNIKMFHHAISYDCGYQNKDLLIKEIERTKNGKEQNQNQNQKQSSKNNIDHPKDNNHNKNEEKKRNKRQKKMIILIKMKTMITFNYIYDTCHRSMIYHFPKLIKKKLLCIRFKNFHAKIKNVIITGKNVY